MAKQKVAASQGNLALEPSFFHYTYMDHQRPAVDAAVSLFQDIPIQSGQVGNTNPCATFLEENKQTLLQNLQTVQTGNCIERTGKICFDPFPQFDIEMETGTGKTYVYVRTIYELLRTHHLCKFIIAVPSKAIFNTVKAQLEDMRYHFEKEEFPEISAAQYIIYEDGDASQLTQFASASFGILLMTIQSFNKFNAPKNKDNNIIYQKNHEDSPNGRPLIELVREMHPVVIIDEPQKGFGTAISKESIRRLLPLCVFNYSATHREHHHLIYKLGPVESNKLKLVKSLTVTGFGKGEDNIEFSFTPYIKLLKCELKKNGSEAIEFEYIDLNKNKAEIKTLKKSAKDSLVSDFFAGNCDLADISGNDAYIGWKFDPRGTVYSNDDRHITINGTKYYLDQAVGEDFDNDALKKLQIETTIRVHLQRERNLIVNRQKLGKSRYKVLSLFFIDRVSNYATSKTVRDGKYAKMFRKAYADIISEFPDVEDYWNERLKLSSSEETNPIDRFHNGYFAISKGTYKDTNETNDSETGAKTKLSAEDQEAIKAIISDKKKLLDPDYPLRFVFSHSALQEGWDNPNVFQICTLTVSHSDIAKRQRLGRGMRIPVDEFGNRNNKESNGRDCGDLKKFEYDESINRLHVIANHSFKHFSDALQKDYANDGVIFGEFTVAVIAQIEVKDEAENKTIRVSPAAASCIMESLKARDYIKDQTYTQTVDGKKQEITTTVVTPKLRDDLNYRPEKITIPLPEDLDPSLQDQLRAEVLKRLSEASEKIIIHSKREKISNKRLDKPGSVKRKCFEELFERIKYKTTYDYTFSTSEFIQRCVRRLEQAENRELKPETILMITGTMEISSGGVIGHETENNIKTLSTVQKKVSELPDIVDKLLEDTAMLITRRTVIEILNQSGTLYKYFEMSDRYLKVVRKIIKEELVKSKLDGGIQYHPNGELYDISIFDPPTDNYPKIDGKDIDTEAQNNYDNDGNRRETRSLTKYVRCDSEKNEQRILEKLELLPNIKMYVKLPNDFEIPTPRGTYIPDWAIVKEVNGEDRLYFIFESKTASHSDIMSDIENGTTNGIHDDAQLTKIACAIKHFEAINTGVQYFPGNVEDLMEV